MTDDRLDRCSIYAHRFAMLASTFLRRLSVPNFPGVPNFSNFYCGRPQMIGFFSGRVKAFLALNTPSWYPFTTKYDAQ
jgi:hypothetical protein